MLKAGGNQGEKSKDSGRSAFDNILRKVSAEWSLKLVLLLSVIHVAVITNSFYELGELSHLYKLFTWYFAILILIEINS